MREYGYAIFHDREIYVRFLERGFWLKQQKSLPHKLEAYLSPTLPGGICIHPAQPLDKVVGSMIYCRY